jgi:hypothetical protein
MDQELNMGMTGMETMEAMATMVTNTASTNRRSPKMSQEIRKKTNPPARRRAKVPTHQSLRMTRPLAASLGV